VKSVEHKKERSGMVNKKVSNTFKRLFFDIEVSPNIVTTWNVGRKINISPDDIIQERAIICVCWKFEGEKNIYSLSWDKGNDKKLVTEFAKVLNSADEVIGHNGDNFDIKWLRTRCLFHGVSLIPDVHSVDTLKLSKSGFRFNSNRLDYIAKFLNVGRKIKTSYGLWTKILIGNSKEAMDEMIKYCKMDVQVLESVFQKLKPYVGHKTHKGVFIGKSNHSCPECGSIHSISNGQRITATGVRKQRMHCQDCGKYHSITIKKTDL
jgi:DNA polymerase elongation subunit (family B)